MIPSGKIYNIDLGEFTIERVYYLYSLKNRVSLPPPISITTKIIDVHNTHVHYTQVHKLCQ